MKRFLAVLSVASLIVACQAATPSGPSQAPAMKPQTDNRCQYCSPPPGSIEYTGSNNEAAAKFYWNAGTPNASNGLVYSLGGSEVGSAQGSLTLGNGNLTLNETIALNAGSPENISVTAPFPLPVAQTVSLGPNETVRLGANGVGTIVITKPNGVTYTTTLMPTDQTYTTFTVSITGSDGSSSSSTYSPLIADAPTPTPPNASPTPSNGNCTQLARAGAIFIFMAGVEALIPGGQITGAITGLFAAGIGLIYVFECMN